MDSRLKQAGMTTFLFLSCTMVGFTSSLATRHSSLLEQKRISHPS